MMQTRNKSQGKDKEGFVILRHFCASPPGSHVPNAKPMQNFGIGPFTVCMLIVLPACTLEPARARWPGVQWQGNDMGWVCPAESGPQ